MINISNNELAAQLARKRPQKQLAKQIEVLEDQGTVKRNLKKEEEDEEDEQEDEVDEDGEEHDEDDEVIDSDSETEGDRPLKKLRLEVIKDMSSKYDKRVERYQDEGVSKDVAKAMASNFLLPTYRKMLRRLYLYYVKWFYKLKTYPVHKEVMATQCRFMDEDDMDFEEATEEFFNQ
ncbi:hypothetical protein OS493_019570 [Desmophyllum pertusum]|uniref:Uncharacterized protein n=1 Tax=Desmophyllum pertusum TaxID=174260 RepID=A0A9W9ZPN4_9CNID|nr:hypothetical protein OS493_019570 [Desmophyllum pertusum]